MTAGRASLIVLLAWGLLIIVPDLARVVRPLSSLGFFADSNGLIYDVTGPFADKTQSPAWKAGVRDGDRLDLSRMRCWPYNEVTCADTLASVGGNLYVAPGRTATLDLEAVGDRPARQVTLTAEQRPSNWIVRGVLLLDQLAGIAVVLAAAWLVWTRSGPMSWGFFLYVLWFNPGQSFEFYAQLQRWPWLLIVQDALGCVAQAAGYAGLLLFVIRSPTDQVQPEWRPYERALPILALAIALALMGSYASAFGFKTEMLTRATILFGLVVSVCAVTILMLRRRSLTPKDNQRLRWVLWGALIGLPAFVLADLSEYTTIFASTWSNLQLPEDAIGVLYLVNGILSLFVFEALRRTRVVSVSIPLRRATVLALTMSLPALLLHKEAEHFQELLQLPQWALLLIGAVIVFAIGQIHHLAVEIADGFFNRDLDKAENEIGEAILQARDAGAIDQLLSDGTLRVLKLASAATFRETEAGFHRFENSSGWDGNATRCLALESSTLTSLSKGPASMISDADAGAAGFPPDLETPLLAVPAASRVHCYAVSVYGPHESGTAIDANEKHVLESLGRHAADAYARLENERLRAVVAALQKQVQPSAAEQESIA